ncbi:hypothetical protein A1O7_03273 [Cladophialophora yegresii CBS 114405]|uniref:RNA helicase n=1 Tax=Cladophialophora yegresii CBS 114405 TaxID=1182544 RepID=W9W4G4_9EURO|nr:uncharacterized protein A1O7_03273 [Cladophialophora yegresii CBS 114405]EXJ62833.1 hypothetical protein A1O7_03273 [Cladophialophora yegresii CBS 114405]
MAPKKKKKPAANPARGFATTSLPSKSKTVAETDDVSVVDDQPTRAAGGDASVHVGEDPGPTDSKQPTDGVQIQDMTPEELEAHLENSELNSMLDKHGPRVIADARRQVARLETERRQLRLQTQKLSTYNWLSEEMIRELSDMAIEDERGTSAAGHIRLHETDEEKLVRDLWTLERVLRSLNFPKVSEAIAYIAELALSNQVKPLIDSVPGLAEALQWYAGNTQSDELTHYEQTSTTKTERSGGSTPAQVSSEPTTVTHSRQSPASTPPKVSDAEDVALTSSDSEEEDDPSKLTDRYIRIQSLIWNVQNQAFDDRQDKGPMKERRLIRWNQKLQHILRDPLFDKWEAESQWRANLLELQAVQQQRMRVAAATRRGKKKQDLCEETVSSDLEATETTLEEHQRDGDDDALLGGMFGESEDAPCAAQNQTASESPVKIIAFPKWTGISPRRLLEELCKTHDSKSRVRFRALVQTSYSARHELEISWAVDIMLEAHTVAALPREISAQITERNWTLGMKDVAAANSTQSEAYISTLALFLLSTIGPGEARATGRLPTVWRDLFKDLADDKQALVNEEHKTTLRRLRALVHETEDKLKQQQDPPLNARAQMPNLSKERSRPRSSAATKISPEQVSREWSSRTSRPSFQQMLEVRRQLPVHQYKDRILSCIEENPVSVICAETGAGKSSGIPVLLLEQAFATSRDCRILVTQPRRISAVTLARRVSQELGESRNDIGTIRSLVGYAIRLESKTSNSTRITYATTGVLLRMLEESTDLDDLDYLILDEVHERTMDLDLLFIALRKLQKRRCSLKIILMSATVSAKKFSDYFDGAPVLDLPGRTFPVDVRFLEDAVEAANELGGVNDKALVLQDEGTDFDEAYADEKGRPVIMEPAKYSSQTQHTVANMDEYRIDYNLIARLAACIATGPQYAKYSAALLIFMPGIGEMRRLHSLLLSMDTFSRNWVVHLLHSTFSTEELERAFERPPPGHRKIVIATNIAETGITIPDVTAVIDTCKEKIMRFDERRQLSRLTEGFISRSSARQRRGRAARVQDGLCFHLVTKHRHDNQMLEQQVPEMLRLSLQDPMLRIKVWDLGSIEETLNAAIDPPSRKNILRAIEKLKDAGALTKNEGLTHLGQQIAKLPLEVSLAKLAIFGVIFKCLDPVLTMISLLTSKSPFLPGPAASSSGQQPNARLSFSRGESDLLSSLHAYESWKKARLARTAQDFCRKNHISDQTMGQVEEQKIQLLVYLVDARLVVLDPDEKGHLNRARSYHGHGPPSYSIPTRYNQPVSDRALNAISAMALYPRILMREGKGWRNVYTNQIVTLTSRSINHPSHSAKPPRWLSFYEAMQNTRSGNLNVFETSAIPESALAILLGSDVEFKFYAGVMVLDGGKVKLSVRQWSELMAIKTLREKVEKVLQQCYSAPSQEVAEQDRKWLDLWLRIEAAQES